MEIFTFTNLYDLEVSSATFVRSDLATFTGLDELGLEVVGQHLEPERAVLACRVIDDDRWCRRLAHEPFGWRPTTLLVRVRRYRCVECRHVWCQDMGKAAEPRAKLPRPALG